MRAGLPVKSTEGNLNAKIYKINQKMREPIPGVKYSKLEILTSIMYRKDLYRVSDQSLETNGLHRLKK